MDLLFPEIAAFQQFAGDKERNTTNGPVSSAPFQLNQSTNSLDKNLSLRNLRLPIAGEQIDLRSRLPGQTIPSATDHQAGCRSFRDVVSNSSQVPPPSRLRPTFIGGNVAVRIDGEKYRRGLARFDNCLIGRLVLFKGNSPLDTRALKAKLQSCWLLPEISWKIIPLGRGFFCLDLQNAIAKSKVFTRGTLSLNPGMFYISKWIPNFNPYTQKITNTQVWIKIHGLSMDYWIDEFLLDIGMGVGTSLKVDRVTSEQILGRFARVLVDVDISGDLPDRILVQIEDYEFFVDIEYEYLPTFCKLCNGIGHGISECRLNTHKTATPRRPATQTMPLPENVPGKAQTHLIDTNNPPASDCADNAAGAAPPPPPVDDSVAVNEVPGSTAEEQRRGEISKETRVANNAERECANQSDIFARPAQVCVDVGGCDTTTHVSESVYSESGTLNLAAQDLAENVESGHNGVALSRPPSPVNSLGCDSANMLLSLPFNCEENLENTCAGLRPPNSYHPYKQAASSSSSSPPPPPPLPRKVGRVVTGGDWDVEENASFSSGNSHRFQMRAGASEVEVKLGNMNIDVIYWIADRGIYIHASGICYDPNTDVFFKRIDPLNGDVRSLHYIRRHGDFFPARNGISGKHNKTIFVDLSWDRSLVFSVKTPNYRPGLPKLFRDKVIEF